MSGRFSHTCSVGCRTSLMNRVHLGAVVINYNVGVVVVLSGQSLSKYLEMLGFKII